MALHLLDKFARNDASVKMVFDHVRNIGLSALVLSAATWQQLNVGTGISALFGYASSTILGFAGLGLFWINHENLFSKIRSKNFSRPLEFIAVIIYSVFMYSLIKFLQKGHH
jgi:hypothetical protein